MECFVFPADKDYWKCVTVLKGEGTLSESGISSDTVATISNASAGQPSAKARYLKLGTISHPNQVPNH